MRLMLYSSCCSWTLRLLLLQLFSRFQIHVAAATAIEGSNVSSGSPRFQITTSSDLDCYKAEITLRTLVINTFSLIGLPCSMSCSHKLYATYWMYWDHNTWSSPDASGEPCLATGTLCTKKWSFQRVDAHWNSVIHKVCSCEITLSLGNVINNLAFSYLQGTVFDCSISELASRFEFAGWQVKSTFVGQYIHCQQQADACLCNWQGESLCQSTKPKSSHEFSPFEFRERLEGLFGVL